MDANRFDALARFLGSAADRRTTVRRLAAALAALVGAGAAGEALACTRDGKECDPKKPGQCCSGICKKAGKKHKCKPAPGAEGCTVDDDICASGAVAVACPGNPAGSCVVLGGKPICAGIIACVDCDSDVDCDAVLGIQGSTCITRCPVCAEGILGLPKACMFLGPVA